MVRYLLKSFHVAFSGSPSGHAMVTTAVLFTVLLFTVKQIKDCLKTSPALGRMADCVAWLCFITIILLVSISRVFIATHFPHQVIGGVIGGIAISYMVQKYTSTFIQMNFKKCIIISFSLILLTLVIYVVLSYAIFDPSESVLKAQKWCVNPSYIHIETRPFYALVRDAGAAFGIGLAHWLCNKYGIYHNTTKSIFNKGIEIAISLICIHLIKEFKVSFSSDVMSYVFGYFKSVCLVVVVVFCVPSMVSAFKKLFKTDIKRN